MGLESGSDRTLKHLKGSHDTVATNYEALRLFKAAGIHVYSSFVLGSQAETTESLRETEVWMKKIMSEGLIADIEVQPVLPLPNNVQGRQLRESGFLPAELQVTDWPWELDRMAELYVNSFSGVKYGACIDVVREIHDVAKAHRLNYGSGLIRKEKIE